MLIYVNNMFDFLVDNKEEATNFPILGEKFKNFQKNL